MACDDFVRDLFAGVNRPADPRNLTDLERRHLPGIDAPPTVAKGTRFPVTVKVGQMLPHPNDRTHFIEFIELYAGDVFLARADMTAVATEPHVTLVVSLSRAVRELRAVARCNRPGMWLATVPSQVTE